MSSGSKASGLPCDRAGQARRPADLAVASRFPESGGRGGSAEGGCGQRLRPAARLGLVAFASLGLGACGSSASRSRRRRDARGPGGRDRRDRLFRGAARDTARLHPPARVGPVLHRREHNDFQTLLSSRCTGSATGGTSLDYSLSIGNAPVYRDDNRLVTITLKHYVWSNGQPVSARDVIFWINLLKANRDEWASYVPGGFPDNVTSATAVDATTVRLRLNANDNPVWFTYNELSQITPLPSCGTVRRSAPAPSAGASDLPDTTPSGVRAVYVFLDAQAGRIGSYASSPVWSVVDGPWKLVGLDRRAGDLRSEPAFLRSRQTASSR